MGIISKCLYKTMIGIGSIVEKKFNYYTKNAFRINKKSLSNIIDKNKDTEFGKEYNFKNIKTLDDFKKNIPLTEYSHYQKYIRKMLNGEDNILVKEPIEYYAHTSGTTNSQKLLPMTRTSRIIASKYMAFLVQKYCYENFKDNFTCEKGIMIADIVKTKYTDTGLPICSATSGGMESMKKILPYMYTSPIEIMYIEDKQTALYLHLLFALLDSNIMYISSVFISNVLDLLRELENSNSDLINDIRKGKITRKLNLDDKTRIKLNSLLTPNASRANKIEQEIKKGYKGIAKRIWPKLSYIVTVTGANFSIYNDGVNFYTDSIPIYSPSLAATEGMMAINPNAKKISYIILPDTVFYEFILEKDCDDKDPITYNLNELKKGCNYEIVLTNYSGLYRYRLGDVVKVLGYVNESPEIEFLYRRKQVLNMVSEKTTEEHLTKALKNTMRKKKLTLVDYTTEADNSISPGRYVVYLELKNKISKNEITTLETTLDYELQKSNLAYGRFRKSHRLEKTKIKVLSPNTFSNIKTNLCKEGISKNQIKVPRVITNTNSKFNIEFNKIKNAIKN